MANTAAPAKLKPEEVRFLALEGGGKGFAYLGALQVLEELPIGGETAAPAGEHRSVMDSVTAVAGTSAGAITALMLALGLTSKEIQAELDSHVFDKFFDPPTSTNGQIVTPEVGGYTQEEPLDCEVAVQSSWRPQVAVRSALAGIQSAGRTSLADMLMAVVSPVLACLSDASLLAKALGSLSWILSGPKELRNALLDPVRRALIQKNANAAAVINTLFDRLPEYLAYLDREMGLFSGAIARTYFDQLIKRRLAEALDRRLPSATPASLPDNITFETLRSLNEDFQLGFRELLVVGANISTGTSQLFSWLHTPRFPIADAIRISMSLPVIYKPYVIAQKIDGFPPCGTYVDGGVWNNLPFREIGALAAAPRPGGTGTNRSTPAAEASSTGQRVGTVVAERHTLGLRLEVVPPQPVLDVQSVIAHVAVIAGETQVLSEFAPFIQVLDTRGLDTLLFSPDEQTKRLVTERSRRAMLRYFNQPVPINPVAGLDEFLGAGELAGTACVPRQPRRRNVRASHR